MTELPERSEEFKKYVLFVSLLDHRTVAFSPLTKKEQEEKDIADDALEATRGANEPAFNPNQTFGVGYNYLGRNNTANVNNNDELRKKLTFKVLKEDCELDSKEKLENLISQANTHLEKTIDKIKNLEDVSNSVKTFKAKTEELLESRTLEREFNSIRYAGYYFGLCVFILDLDSSMFIDSNEEDSKPNEKTLGEMEVLLSLQTAYIKCIINPLLDLRDPNTIELKNGFAKLANNYAFHWAAIPIEAEPGELGLGAAIHHIMTGDGIPNTVMLGASGGIGGGG